MSHSTETPLSEINRQSSLEDALTDSTNNLFYTSIFLSDLFKIIFAKLHPLFSIDCAALLIYDEHVNFVKAAYISTCQNNHEEIRTEVIDQPIELDKLQKTVADFSFPVIKSMEEWIEEENRNHCLVNNESRYKYHCYIPLEINNQVLGTFELHNDTKELSAECLTFCSSIADMLADIIHLKRTAPALIPNSNLNTTINITEKTNNLLQPTFTPNNEVLLQLNEKVAHINSINTLADFFAETAKLFPLAYENIKSQLNEIELHKKQLEDEKIFVADDAITTTNYPEIIGAGRGMRNVFALMDQVASSESTVLILGETGTGKELIARAIHETSARNGKLMIKVNCAAIPANLMESELFGHEKGAFTGATDKRIGKFELADNSTLFLDEIGELPLDLQVKLLRVLQEKEIERVGGKTTIKTDVRIISATNRNLLNEVEKGRFRRDLYYRLNVFPIQLPALKDRVEDIPLLASYFLAKYAHKAGKQLIGFTQRAINQMKNYNWPGNVREMEHLIERQVLLSKKPHISEIDIATKEKTVIDEEGAQQKIKTIDENERDHIFAVLQICKGRISGPEGAAKLLGVPATTLNSKIKRLGLNKKHF